MYSSITMQAVIDTLSTIALLVLAISVCNIASGETRPALLILPVIALAVLAFVMGTRE